MAKNNKNITAAKHEIPLFLNDDGSSQTKLNA
jgi:hypothetical protein